VQVRREVGRRVERGDVAEAVGLGLEHPGAQLEFPQHLERPALIVVVEAHQPDPRRLAEQRARDHLLDEVLAMAHQRDVAGAGQLAGGAAGRAGEQRRRGGVEIAAEQARGEVVARPAGVVEPVGATRLLELVAAEQPRDRRQVEGGGAGQALDLLVLGRGGRQRDREVAAELDQARLGEDRQHGRRRGGPGHRASLPRCRSRCRPAPARSSAGAAPGVHHRANLP
jgi:hypothetical protein